MGTLWYLPVFLCVSPGDAICSDSQRNVREYEMTLIHWNKKRLWYASYARGRSRREGWIRILYRMWLSMLARVKKIYENLIQYAYVNIHVSNFWKKKRSSQDNHTSFTSLSAIFWNELAKKFLLWKVPNNIRCYSLLVQWNTLAKVRSSAPGNNWWQFAAIESLHP